MENKKNEQHFRSGYFFRALSKEYNPFRPNRIIITDDFFEFKKRNWHLVSVDSRKFHFRNIVGVDVDKHLFGATISIDGTGNKSIKVNGLSKKTANKISDICSDYISGSKQKGKPEANVKATQGSGDTTISVSDELMKLKALVNDGILTQEEFEEQKAKLLSR